MTEVALAGMNFEGRAAIIKKYGKENMPVVFVREPDNKYDSNAIAIYIEGGGKLQQIGYINKDDAANYSKSLAKGKTLDGWIRAIYGGTRDKPSLGVALEIYIIPKGKTQSAFSPIPDPAPTPAPEPGEPKTPPFNLGHAIRNLFK